MRNGLVAYLVAVFLLFGFFGYYTFNLFLDSGKTVPGVEHGKFIAVPLLAVDENNDGLVIPLHVELKPGTGKVLINIDNPSFILDTQDSMRLAVKEAAEMTNMDLTGYDVVFSLQTDVSIIGGPSAGAAMTLATMALLLDKQLKTDVAITGTIVQGGYIGQVGGIIEKAEAAKSAGYELLLVPEGEAYSREAVENCTERAKPGWAQKECFITYLTVNVSDETGISVEEVDTITEAMKYMIA
jgi:uncharacterized protein